MNAVRWSAWAVVITSGVLAAAPVSGQERRGVAREVTIDAEELAIEELAAQLSRETGHQILVDPEVRARISLRLRRVPWRVAVDLIAERARLKVEELPRGPGGAQVLLLRRPPRVSIQCADAEVRTVLLMLARYAGKSVVIGPEVRGRVTLDLRDVEYVHAMRAVAQLAGDYAVLGGGDLLETGRRGGTRTERADPPERSLAGRFVALERSTVLVTEASQPGVEQRPGSPQAQGAVDPAVVRLELPRSGALRERLQATLATLRPGDRLVASYTAVSDPAGARFELRSLVAEGR